MFNSDKIKKMSRRKVGIWTLSSIAACLFALVRPRGLYTHTPIQNVEGAYTADDLIQQILLARHSSHTVFKETLTNYAPFYKTQIIEGTHVNGVDISSDAFASLLSAQVEKHAPELLAEYLAITKAYYQSRYTVEELNTIVRFVTDSAGRKMSSDVDRPNSELGLAFKPFKEKLVALTRAAISEMSLEQKSIT